VWIREHHMPGAFDGKYIPGKVVLIPRTARFQIQGS
jgi:hypothetical protein